jgi:hypothetical protein
VLSLHTEAVPPPESPEGGPGEGEPGEGDAGEGAGAAPACAAFGLDVGARNVAVGTGTGVGPGVIVGGDVTGGSVNSSSEESHLKPI